MSLFRVACEIAFASFFLASVLDVVSKYQKWLEPLGSSGEINLVRSLQYATILALGALVIAYKAKADGLTVPRGTYFLVGISALVLAVNLGIGGFAAWREFGN